MSLCCTKVEHSQIHCIFPAIYKYNTGIKWPLTEKQPSMFATITVKNVTDIETTPITGHTCALKPPV